ncbi:MAG: BrnA antitoxin family protein [Candidatus Electrothrix scaldis]|nr:MAG: BrnA antitoxin family protein [Candidatus Electrothrix sp. GW3-3]
MSTAKYTTAQLKEMKSETDWQRVDAMSDESIARAVETDPDARLLEADDFKKMRRRGPQKAPRKDRVTIRLTPEVLAFFKNQGKGWQTKINEVLQNYVNSHNASLQQNRRKHADT